MVNSENKIILTESKAWNNHYTELENINTDLNNAGIQCELIIKKRKTAANNGD